MDRFEPNFGAYEGCRSVIRRTATLLSVLALGAACTSAPSTPAPSTASSSAAPSASKATSAPPTAESSGSPTNAKKEPAKATLPRGGRQVFPRHRLVGYAGLTGAKTLGRLGTGPLDQRLREIEHRAKPYAAGREIQPIIEVVTTIVQASPGRDHRYRARLSDEQIGRYLKAARKHDAILLLNIQPGRARFIDEVKAYERWLDEPDVGVALDPEWAMGRHQVPGRVFGHTTGAELDRVARYLARIVAREDLPEKIMVYHQLAARIVRRESELQPHKGIVMIKSVDGIGRPAAKIRTYRVVDRTTPSFVHAGFKLFFTEDEKSGRLMRPEEILRLHPRPEYVLYE